ncbi:hypothetical protein MEBOL_003860 [Melittangium boletus DSM 14713]|uniref:Uncharacterized protein n=1 Tax=Melittangium boletus DSM 14713 TaxID=1294270 RepID=A0A250IEZ1_9BACT|nr:hypothetical protein MEBOL_003860 [Melittangium boletus DSM 14713]
MTREGGGPGGWSPKALELARVGRGVPKAFLRNGIVAHDGEGERCGVFSDRGKRHNHFPFGRRTSSSCAMRWRLFSKCNHMVVRHAFVRRIRWTEGFTSPATPARRARSLHGRSRLARGVGANPPAQPLRGIGANSRARLLISKGTRLANPGRANSRARPPHGPTPGALPAFLPAPRPGFTGAAPGVSRNSHRSHPWGHCWPHRGGVDVGLVVRR